MMINQHWNESVNHRGSRTWFTEVRFVHSLSGTYYREACLERVATPLTGNQISTSERHLFPVIGLLCATFRSVFELDWMWSCPCQCSSPAIPWNSPRPSGLQMSFPSMSVTGLIKVHFTSNQGISQLGSEEGTLKACCWECRGNQSEKHLLSGYQHLCSYFSIPFIKNCGNKWRPLRCEESRACL